MHVNQLVKPINRLVKKIIPPIVLHPLARYMRWFKAPLYFGDCFFCPICEGEFKVFFSTGLPMRLNSVCPRCFCKERHRLLWLYLQKHTEFFIERHVVLHVAPMDSMQRKLKKMINLEYVSIDRNSSRAMIEMDVTELKFSDNKFDCILCLHVLEHVHNDVKAIGELFRVVKPGGWAIIQVPIERETTLEDPNVTTDSDCLRVYGQKDHVRSYGLDYKERLETVGFHVTLDAFHKKMSLAVLERYGLSGNLESEHLYFCTKQ